VNLILAKRPEPEQAAPASIVRRFLVWAQAADAGERADAASALARAYRYSEFPEALRREAVVALTAVLDDKSILVRRALAEALASAEDAPRHIVLALAHDQPEVAAIMVARSPVLNDADLVDCAAIGDDYVQMELARRTPLGLGAAAALAEIGCRDSVLALLENHDAHVTAVALRRIAERFSEDGEIREALLERAWLPASLRCDLVAATAQALSPLAAAFGLGAHRIERLMKDACEEGAILVAGDAEGDDLARLIRHLRDSGGLTVSLLIRGLVSGDSGFFQAAAAELSGLPPARVSAFIRAPNGPGFAALYRRTGLPAHYFPAFRAGAAAAIEFGPASKGAAQQIAARIIARCEAEGAPGLDRLLSLLRRLEVQGALQEARAFAAEVVAEQERGQRAPPPPALVAAEPVFEEPPPLLFPLNEEEQAEISDEQIEMLFEPIEPAAPSEETVEMAEAPLESAEPPQIEDEVECVEPLAEVQPPPIEDVPEFVEGLAEAVEPPPIEDVPEFVEALAEVVEPPIEEVAQASEVAKAA